MNVFRRGRSPPGFSPRGAEPAPVFTRDATCWLWLGHRTRGMPSSLSRSAGRQPRGLPLPPHGGGNRVAVMKSMVPLGTDARSSSIGVDAGNETRNWKLDARQDSSFLSSPLFCHSRGACPREGGERESRGFMKIYYPLVVKEIINSRLAPRACSRKSGSEDFTAWWSR